MSVFGNVVGILQITKAIKNPTVTMCSLDERVNVYVCHTKSFVCHAPMCACVILQCLCVRTVYGTQYWIAHRYIEN